jgi:hypothetical protein
MNIDTTKKTKIISKSRFKTLLKKNFPEFGILYDEYIVYKGVSIEPFMPDCYYDDIIRDVCLGAIDVLPGDEPIVSVSIYRLNKRVYLTYKTDVEKEKVLKQIFDAFKQDLFVISKCLEKERDRLNKILDKAYYDKQIDSELNRENYYYG